MIAEIEAFANQKISEPLSWEDQFLSWFSTLEIPMAEKQLKLGGLEYFHFATLLHRNDGGTFGGFGSDQSRKLAALKSAAESIERLEMLEYFGSSKCNIPKAFHTSNGWAVQSSLEVANEKAFSEALERHLLLKSFFSRGWSGFNCIQKIEGPEVDLYLLTTQFSHGGHMAAMVIAKSHLYRGVSFGYGLGRVDQMSQAVFWQSAIYEAVDKILVLAGRDPKPSSKNWIREEIEFYLTNNFDFSILPQIRKPSYVECVVGEVHFETIDLSKKYNLQFPLFASFASGSGLIPLFTKSMLDSDEIRYLENILAANNIFEVPERHPIL